MTRLVLRILFAVASPAVLLLLPTAQAQPAPPDKAKLEVARSYVDAGLAAQNTGDYDTAITFYTKAYEVVPHPLLLFNLAQAHRLAGHMDQAVELYRKFLAADSTGPEAQLARDLLAEIEGRKMEGSGGAEEAHDRNEDGEGQTVQGTATLRVSGASSSVDPTAPRRPGFFARHRWSMSFGIGGFVAGGAGLAMGGLTWRDYRHLAQSCAHTVAGCPDNDVRRVEREGLVTNVLFGVAAAAAVGAIVGYFVGDDRSPDERPAVVVVPSGRGITLDVRF